MQSVRIAVRWLASSLFVIFGFVSVLVEIDQALAWQCWQYEIVAIKW
jgi:hypothetical protein